MNSSARNAILYSIGEIVPRAIGFVMLPLYTRYLSPSDFGIISYTNTVVLFLFTIGALSLNSYALRFFFLKEGEEQRNMLGTIAISIFLFNLCILVLCHLFLPYIIEYYHIQVPWKPFFQLAIITNFLDSFSIIPFVIYRVKGAAEKFVLLGLSKTFFVVALTIYTVIWRGDGLSGYYWSQFCVYLPFSIVYLIILKQYVNFSFSIPLLKEGFAFSLPLVPSSICYLLLNASDRIILERNVPMSTLGIYNMAITLSFALNVIVQGGYRAFEPVIYGNYGKKDYADLVKKIKNIFFLIVLAGGIFISLFAKEVFVLMTESQFHEGYIYVPLLVSVVVISSINCLYSVILAGDKQTKIMAASAITGGVVSVVLNLLFIPCWGVFVAAITQNVGVIVITYLNMRKLRVPNLTMWNELLMLVGMIVSAYVLYYILPNVSLVEIIIKLLLFLVIVFVLLRANGYSIEDVVELMGLKRKER